MWGLNIPWVLRPNSSITINSSILNYGSSDESNVTVRFYVNGTNVKNASINFISNYTWTYANRSWTPTQEGWYNITVYAAPVSGESVTENNVKSKWVLVRTSEALYVPNDFPTIQRAVTASSEGYTIQVASGTYREYVHVGKANLTLIGENNSDTIIDSEKPSDRGVVITQDYINITGFSIKNSNSYGLFIEHGSHYNVIINNIFLKNTQAIFLHYSDWTTIANNTIVEGWSGIHLYSGCDHNLITGNNISGFRMNNAGRGIALSIYNTDNTFVLNTISNNTKGITTVSSLGNTNNTFVCNNITNNDVGVDSNAGGNTFYHNNFINNTQQVGATGGNVWDNGYPSGGNYWSDYNGNDTYSGPYQNETGSDGIGDTPKSLPAGDKDNYPFMNPNSSWTPIFDVAVLNVSYSLPYNASAVYPGWELNITVTVENQGNFTETFQVTAYYNSTAIQTKTVNDLASGANTTVTFVNWNTSSVSGYADYQIKARAQIPGETDTADNTYNDGNLRVRWPGDTNDDGHVNGYDATVFSLHYGTEYPDPDYAWYCDFNGDGKVDDIDEDILDDNWYNGPLD